ncbi:MAG: zf-HC2 domain-containing protein [Pyrinomonadaceae bacterium]
MSEKKCLNKKKLHLFLAGETSTTDKEEVESHLAECAVCRREVSAFLSENKPDQKTFETPVDLLKKVKNLPKERADDSLRRDSSSPWFKWNFLQVAFAAGLLACFGFFGIYYLQLQQTPTRDDTFRHGSSSQNRISLSFPIDNSELTAEDAVFRWGKIEEAKNYTVVFSDEKGDIIRVVTTDKTELSGRISEFDLRAGKYYFWQVKTRLVDGSVLESETRKLRIK